MAPAGEGLSLAATLQRHLDKKTRAFLQMVTVPDALSGSVWKWDAQEAQPLPEPLVPPLWYLPEDTLAHATQRLKKTFPPPQPPDALLHRLRAGAAWVRWRENGRPGPNVSLVQGQALLHAKGIGTVEWGTIVPDTAGRWITAAALHAMRPPSACHHLLRTVCPLAPLPRPHLRSVACPAEPPQGLNDGPRRTIPSRAGTSATHGTHTLGPPRPAQGVGPNRAAHRRGAGPSFSNPCGYSPRMPISDRQASPTGSPTCTYLRRPKQVHFCTVMIAKSVQVVCPIYLLFLTTKFEDNSIFWPNYPQKCIIFLQKRSHKFCNFTHSSVKCTIFSGILGYKTIFFVVALFLLVFC